MKISLNNNIVKMTAVAVIGAVGVATVRAIGANAPK